MSQSVHQRFSVRFRLYLSTALALLLLCGLMVACQSPDSASEGAQAEEAASGVAGKKILYVDSYHKGYEWSDGIEAGLTEALDGTGVELEIVRLDSKNVTDKAGREAAAANAKAEFDAFKPDVVIAADDTAQEYVVVPYLKGTSTPVIFCGVNWDASSYGFPTSNVTGMLEVDFVTEMMDGLKAYANGETVGYLTGDTSTDTKLADIYNERFFDGKMKVYFVTTFDEWKQAFVTAQEEVDILYAGNNAGISDWDDQAAREFVLANTTIPTGSRQEWMAPYVLMTYARSPEEQGRWSAETALSILDGTAVSDIPVAENKEVQLILNLDVAQVLDVVFSPSQLRNAEVIGSGEGG